MGEALRRNALVQSHLIRDLLDLSRLRSGKLESLETSSLHLDVLRDLKRINSHLTSVAYPILDAAGELERTRLKAEPS